MKRILNSTITTRVYDKDLNAFKTACKKRGHKYTDVLRAMMDAFTTKRLTIKRTKKQKENKEILYHD